MPDSESTGEGEASEPTSDDKPDCGCQGCCGGNNSVSVNINFEVYGDSSLTTSASSTDVQSSGGEGSTSVSGMSGGM